MGIHIYQNLNLSERDRLRTIKFLLLLIANERLSYVSETPLLLGFLLLQDRRSLDSKFGMKVQTVLIDKKNGVDQKNSSWIVCLLSFVTLDNFSPPLSIEG